MTDIAVSSVSDDVYTFTSISVNSIEYWSYNWDTNTFPLRNLIPGKYSIYAVSEPKNKEDISSVRYDSEQFYLINKDYYINQALIGNTVIVTVFIDGEDTNYQWDNNEIKRYLWEITVSKDYLITKSQEQEINKKLNIEILGFDSDGHIVNDIAKFSPVRANYGKPMTWNWKEWMPQALNNLDIYNNYNGRISNIVASYKMQNDDVDNVVLLFIVPDGKLLGGGETNSKNYLKDDSFMLGIYGAPFSVIYQSV